MSPESVQVSRRHLSHLSGGSEGNGGLPSDSSCSNSSVGLNEILKNSNGSSIREKTIDLPSEILVISAQHENALPVLALNDSKCKKLLSSNHFASIKNASSGAILFMEFAASFGIKTATHLATKLHWKLQPPLRELRAMWSGRGKSYTKRNAKTRPLSDSQASSRKRSSSA